MFVKIKYKKEFWFYLILLFGGLISFLPSLRGTFLAWDDVQYVVENNDIRQINLLRYFTNSYLGNYQPLTIFAYSLIYKFTQLDPFGYHLASLLIHLLNSLLVMLIGIKVFKNHLHAFFLALLFCVHPMQVESVAWIAELKNVLYTLFFLSSIIFFIRSIDANKKTFYFLSLLLFCFSLLSKGQAVTLPFTIIAILLIMEQRAISRATLLKLIPFFILALVFGIVAIYAQENDGYINQRHFYSWSEKIGVACFGYFQYLFKIIFPINLSAFYPYPDQIPNWYLLFSVPLLGLVYLFFHCIKSTKFLIAGCLLGFSVNIAVILQLIPVGEAMLADRYVYIPIVFLFIFLIYFLPPKNIFIRGAYSAIILSFCSLTYMRSQNFITSMAFLTDAEVQYPENEIILNSLGVEYLKLKNTERATYYLAKAVKKDSLFFQAQSNYGTLLNMKGEYELAIYHFTRATQLEKSYYPAYYGMATSLNALQKTDEAIMFLDTVILIQPSYAKAWLLQGICLSKKGQELEAIKLYAEAEKRGERSATLYFNRAVSFGNMQDYSSAVNELDKAIFYNNEMSQAYYLRGIAKIRTGKKGCDDLNLAYQQGYLQAKSAIETYCK